MDEEKSRRFDCEEEKEKGSTHCWILGKYLGR
jgi:hypothetical protein